MDVLDVVQGSPEWRAARAGSLGASQLNDALAKTKSGWGASRANLMAQLIVERLTGTPTDTFTSGPMLWGVENEPLARDAYAFRTDAEVTEVGLVRHPKIAKTHASPDGLVGDNGLLEIKCPNSATHQDTLLGGSVPGKYRTQIAWQLACTGRQWCDFVSFDPRLPGNMRLFVRRLHKDELGIPELENEARHFLTELDAKLDQLQEAVARAA